MNKSRGQRHFSNKGAANIDYKNVDTLKTFITDSGRIIPSRLTGTKIFDQRKVARAIKRARFLALIPYCDRHE